MAYLLYLQRLDCRDCNAGVNEDIVSTVRIHKECHHNPELRSSNVYFCFRGPPLDVNLGNTAAHKIHLLDEKGNANTGLMLRGCRITNAVRCLPPQNKPEPAEIKQCNPFLASELEALPQGAAVRALGSVAHAAVLRALDLRAKDFSFGHGAEHVLPNGMKLYDSYHCSRYNTQTTRLTEAMFHNVFRAISGY